MCSLSEGLVEEGRIEGRAIGIAEGRAEREAELKPYITELEQENRMLKEQLAKMNANQ